MKTLHKGFISPLLLALVALLLLGGGAYVYVQKQGNQNVAIQASDLKTYSNVQYGFEFTYPATWTVTETKSESSGGNGLSGTTYKITLAPPHVEASSITFSISPEQKGTYNCPVSTHEIKCETLENKNGFQYTRTINTGQLQYDKQQQLNGYFFNVGQGTANVGNGTADVQGQMITVLTDISGTALPFSTETVSVFDGILQSIKFAARATSTPIGDGEFLHFPGITSADQILNYSKDATHVYYKGVLIPNGDPATIKVIVNSATEHEYAKDKSHVYYRGDEIIGADPVSFKTFAFQPYEGTGDGPYEVDATHVFYEASLIPEADRGTFKMQIGDYASDKNHVFLKGKIVPNADPKTFKFPEATIG